MNKILDDISTISTIPYTQLLSVADNMSHCICHQVLENSISGENVSEIDIGIGTLYVIQYEDNLKYQFIPSAKLEKELIQTLDTKCSPLIDKAGEILQKRIISAYKEML